MPKRSPKQREAFKALAEARTVRAHRYAFRLGPYVAAWQAERLSQRELANALNEAGAPVPSEYTGEPYAPVPVKQWTLRQVQRLLDQIPVAQRKMAFWAKRHGKSNVFPFGDGAGLFAHPELAPRYARNKSREPSAKELSRMTTAEYARHMEEELARVRPRVQRQLDELANMTDEERETRDADLEALHYEQATHYGTEAGKIKVRSPHRR